MSTIPPRLGPPETRDFTSRFAFMLHLLIFQVCRAGEVVRDNSQFLANMETALCPGRRDHGPDSDIR